MTSKLDLLSEGAVKAPSYWSDLKSELSRKTTDVIGDIAHKHENGEITEREFRLMVDAVFDTLNGLAAREVTDMLYALRRELSL